MCLTVIQNDYYKMHCPSKPAHCHVKLNNNNQYCYYLRTSIFQTFPKNLLAIKICKDEDPSKSLLPLQHWKVQLNKCSFLSNDSEDHFGSGCWTINHQKQSFSGLISPRWSNSIQARIDCICTQLVRYVQHCEELLDAYWFFRHQKLSLHMLNKLQYHLW